jgi:hypothetical protein
MGENAQKIGKKLEGFGEKMYKRFNWTELNRDEEIKCINLLHKTKKENNKRTHGIDLLHTYYDPYLEKKIGVVTECKNYGWDSINQSNLQIWFDQLLWTIECSQISEEVKESTCKCDLVNTGILLVHANDGKYDETKFREYIGKLDYKSRKNSTSIFIASNYEIERWDSMFNYIENEYKGNDSFRFYSPSILGSKLQKLEHITINQMFSDFIFAECQITSNFNVNGKTIPMPITQNIVFSFDVISEASFHYLVSMFKELQLENSEEYVFCFYPNSQSDVKLVEEKFEICAFKSLTESKVKKVILDNRNLSPVDIK